MRITRRTIILNRNWRARTISFCLFGLTGAAKGQSVIAPPPSYSTLPPAVMADQLGREGNIQNGASTFSLPGPADLMQWGPVTIRPHLDYRALYGDGVQSAPGQPNATLIQQFTPGATFYIGTHISLDYSPSLTFYSSSQLHNTLDQSVSLTWGSSYEDWVFGLSQSYSKSDDPTVETGTQTGAESYSTSASASYRFNSKMSIDMALTQSLSYADQFTSSSSWATTEWLNYQFWPRLNGAVGVVLGYDNVSAGSDMTHEQLQARVSWRAYDKLSLSVNGGLEDRQFLGGGISDIITPVFGVMMEWDPVAVTGVSLSASRAITPSYFESQAAETTTLGVTLTQRLLKRLSLTLGGAYTQVSYLSAAADVAAGRTDSYYSVNTALSFQFLRRATASVTYAYSVNSSSASGFSFSSSQAGVELGYRY